MRSGALGTCCQSCDRRVYSLRRGKTQLSSPLMPCTSEKLQDVLPVSESASPLPFPSSVKMRWSAPGTIQLLVRQIERLRPMKWSRHWAARGDSQEAQRKARQSLLQNADDNERIERIAERAGGLAQHRRSGRTSAVDVLIRHTRSAATLGDRNHSVPQPPAIS